MGNLFDSIQNNVFATVANTFGNSASWMPSNGPEKLATVLYKGPTEKHGLSDQDFEVERFQMEYLSSDFDGLKQSVAAGNIERVTIETAPGISQVFFVRRTIAKYDGKTIVAYLTPTE